MKKLLLFLAVLLLAEPATADIIVSAQSGSWTDPATWSGGVLPGASDTAAPDHYITVPDGVDIESAITYGNDGELVFLGDTTIEGAVLMAANAANSFTVNRAATVTLNTTNNPAIFGVLGTIRIYGNLKMGAASEGTANAAIIQTSAGCSVEGNGQVLGSSRVDSVPIDATQGTDGLLTITVPTAPPAAATHVRVQSGRLGNMIWPIASASGTTLELDGALALGFNAGSLIVKAVSGRDSILVLDAALEPDEVENNGALVVTGAGVKGQVEKIFNNSATNYTALFVDREPDLSDLGVTEPYLLTWGIAPGFKFEYLRMAQIWGGDDEPSTDNTLGGNVNTGKGEARQLKFGGPVDLSLVEMRWLGATAALQVSGIVSTGTSPQNLTRCLFYESASAYTVGQFGTNVFTALDCAFYRALGPDDGNNGHWWRPDAGTTGSEMYVTGSIAVGLKDDFCANFGGGTVVLQKNRAIDWGSGNFVDVGTQADQIITVKHNATWGMGETPLTFDGPTVDGRVITSEGNRFVNSGNGAGRKTVDDHELWNANGNAFGFTLLEGTNLSFTSGNDTIRWANHALVAAQQASSADTLRFNNTVFENCLTYQDPEPATSTWTNSSQTIGNFYISPTGGDMVFDGVKMVNPFRRGMDLAALGFTNTSLSLGFTLRGTANYTADYRRMYFAMPQSIAEGFAPAATSTSTFMTAGTQYWAGGGLSHSYVEIPWTALRFTAIWSTHSRTTPVFRNIFVDTGPVNTSYTIPSSTCSYILKHNIFYRSYDSGQIAMIRLLDASQNSVVQGNLIILSGTTASNAAFAFSAAFTTNGTIKNNRILTAGADIVNGGGTIATLNGYTNGSGNTGSTTGSGDALWNGDVVDLETFRLLQGGGSVDLDDIDLDPDGTNGDLGPKSFDNRARWETSSLYGGDVGGFQWEPSHLQSGVDYPKALVWEAGVINVPGNGSYAAAQRYINLYGDYDGVLVDLARAECDDGIAWIDSVRTAFPDWTVGGYTNINHCVDGVTVCSGAGDMRNYADYLYDNGVALNTLQNPVLIWQDTSSYFVNPTTGSKPWALNTDLITGAMDVQATYLTSAINDKIDWVFFDYADDAPYMGFMDPGDDNRSLDFDGDTVAEWTESGGWIDTDAQAVWDDFQRNWAYAFRRKFGTRVPLVANGSDSYTSPKFYMDSFGSVQFERFGYIGATSRWDAFETLLETIERTNYDPFIILQTNDIDATMGITEPTCQGCVRSAVMMGTQPTNSLWVQVTSAIADVWCISKTSTGNAPGPTQPDFVNFGQPLGDLAYSEFDDSGETRRRYVRQFSNGWARVRFNLSTGACDSVAFDTN